MPFTPILEIALNSFGGRTIFTPILRFDPYVYPRGEYSCGINNPEIRLNEFFIKAFQENGRYWMDTPQNINTNKVTDITSIFSSTGWILVTLKSEENIFELKCTSIEDGIFHNIEYITNCRQFFNEIAASTGGLHYRIITGKGFKIKDWAYIKDIKPYYSCVNDNGTIKDRDLYGAARKYFNSSVYAYGRENLKFHVKRESNTLKFTINAEETSHRRGDRDGGFDHDVNIYSAYAVKSFASVTELSKYLENLINIGIEFGFDENGVAEYETNKTIYQIENELGFKFYYSHDEYTEPC